mmetsp:Transcript_16628/g.52974  ORF Transcript_16628/g.52974 Transcript_16628/m.52974 type:complete len:243 (-) Transcript_16628:477-1205(-)
MEQRRNSGASAEKTSARQSGVSVSAPPLVFPDDLYSLVRDSSRVVLARVCLVASAAGSTDVVVQHLEAVLASCARRGKFTGLQLVSKPACLLVIEGRSEEVFAVLAQLHHNEATARSTFPFSCMRVISTCDDVPARVFRSFVEQQVALPKEPNFQLPEGDITSQLFDTHAKLLQVGQSLSEGKGLDDVKGKLPSNERVQAFAKHPDVLDLSDFHELFGCPIESQSIFDDVWPMQQLIEDLQV